jgi:hypothetical protein
LPSYKAKVLEEVRSAVSDQLRLQEIDLIRRSLLIFGTIAAFALLLSAPQLRADGGYSDTFTFTEQLSPTNTLTVQWSLPASPNPCGNYVDGIGFAEVGVPTSYFLNGSYAGTTLDPFLFLSNAAGGGFMDGLLFGLGGTNQIYSGPESNPTFIPGVYSGFDSLNLTPNGNLISATLTVATPEPSSLILLFFGFLVILGTLAAKKVQA